MKPSEALRAGIPQVKDARMLYLAKDHNGVCVGCALGTIAVGAGLIDPKPLRGSIDDIDFHDLIEKHFGLQGITCITRENENCEGDATRPLVNTIENYHLSGLDRHWIADWLEGQGQ